MSESNITALNFDQLSHAPGVEVERDVMEYDVCVVGAGPAGLAFAIRLKQLNPESMICVLEKGSELGAHSLSGAVLEAAAMDELLPEWRNADLPIKVAATKDEFFILSKTKATKFITPPQMNNHGNYIISLGGLVKWLGEQAEALEIDVFPGFSAQYALLDGDKVIGVRCGDMGQNHDGTPSDAFAPGVEIHAKLTVLAEGCRGSVSKQLIDHFELDKDCSPQTYGLGLKELWKLPEGRVQPGLIQHTVGWPVDNKTYGGSFLYHLDNDRIYIGYVVGLDYQDPNFAPFEAFQQFKHHPKIKALLEGGEILSSGARTIIEGGYQSLPTMEMPGAVLIGDAAGTLNVPKIKGIHMALRGGMQAAKLFHEKQSMDGFTAAFKASPAGKELKKVRNMRPGFNKGFWFGMFNAMLETATFGLLPWTLKNHSDHDSLKKLEHNATPERDFVERDLPPRDRLASVYFAATEHDESQPHHLRVRDTNICATTCATEYGNPCTKFCPAHVYEMVDDGQGGKKLHINAANCVHCKACDIKDPYQIIDWVPPEGGSGPNYQNL
ncbi:MAG: electron transfer flavoprotein-ubiquinone oxidoreductase [Gammaproteobacteria bacterium]|nr:electron transfer flavoprotein-ubiquinone oxidoreductase [Gammaproteobacteria bacterium]NNC96676.1 electron transfer flavoprotein-ubiquinone oxidoreductase [Gammaproteobacteria bacterium]NNM13226.1 electron transfer flavoprotein-ubiquinone oxidoreductase [Gammaproteobacteria bacterium]